MTPEEELALKEVAYKLIGIATGQPEAELPIDHPPGMVAVFPTGVLGKGKRHLWPEYKPEMGNVLGYGMICAQKIDPATGKPFFPPGELGLLTPQMFGGLMAGETPPMALDRIAYPALYWDADEIERRKAADAQWAETIANMGG